ncbi:MAG: adenylate/guanylate cyclase domain-containing protein, partial [Chloroflexota bacterium]
MIPCDICRFMNPEGFVYCGRCGNWLSNTQASDDDPINETIEGERKQVTVIFADISGFTALNDAAQSVGDVEQVLQIVNHCMHMLSEAVYEYDGYIDKYMGDALMAVFGAPRIHEDDPERALRAALLMRERLDEFNKNPPLPLTEPLGIHMGINTGTVIAGLVGGRRKRSYTVMGDAVNIASRLESVSERGEFLVNQDTYNLTHRLFIFKERDPVHVKGKRDPLQIYELIGARSQRASQRGIAGLRAPLIGREREIDSLRTQMAQLQQGQGSINVVIGDAGLGKSRLTFELHQETKEKMPNVAWFEGRSLSFQQHVSYKLFNDIFRLYLEVSGDESNDEVWQLWQERGQALFGAQYLDIIPYLATLMGIKLPDNITQNMPLTDPVLLHQRLFDAVGKWVECLVEQQPLVLVFEDMHWADTNSVNLLEFLISISQRLPLLLLCITRPERTTRFWEVKEYAREEQAKQYLELSLIPLNNDQSRVLVDVLLSVDKNTDVLDRHIIRPYDGNTLF